MFCLSQPFPLASAICGRNSHACGSCATLAGGETKIRPRHRTASSRQDVASVSLVPSTYPLRTPDANSMYRIDLSSANAPSASIGTKMYLVFHLLIHEQKPFTEGIFVGLF